VIFDCDGVLIESEVLACHVEAKLLTNAGFPVTVEEIFERFVGMTYKGMLTIVEQEHGKPVPDDMYPSIREGVFAEFEHSLVPVPGAAAAAQAVDAAGLMKCVASSSGHERLRYTLGLTDLFELFAPHIFSGVDVPNSKPAPDLFLAAAKAMSTSPDYCLVVEDSVAGVRAGRAAGMEVVGFYGGAHCTPTSPRRLKDAGATTLIASLGELAALL
jgi:HAD superfamily hydrolase (TIGR01509 family)